ncbi:hypothetical protein U9M48_039074 [Paspalum notatum var. saurae]|uniref:Uncharacterized protein n=1 Tax=Paspalum notatum var. saurae TaxID=547442 RepID=A0AAQ3UIV1_PASNO
MVERVYNNPKWRKVPLETPSGFALFEVDEFVFEEPDDIWVYFSDLTAKKDLMRLIHKFCDDKIDLFVQSADLQAVITKKLNVKCSYDPSVADELVWGLKNILHGVLREENDNITREYCLPMSKGLQRFLQDNLININADFISEMGLVQYLNITLKKVPKILRESYDEYVCKIGDSIQNDLKYAKVLARILVPELTTVYDFIKIQEAEKAATQYRKEKLTMRDRETIFGGLSHLVTVPNQRDDVMTRLKLTEAKLRRAEEDCSAQPVRDPETMTFRRTLLETPSGFAIFDVSEELFESQSIWSWFTDEMDARLVVLALGFVKVQDKSIACNSCDGPREELSRLIQKLCAHKKILIVQDDDLKAVIEEKLEVKCYTKSSNGDASIDDLIWGLKFVLHEFVPEEKDNITYEYYHPPCMGLKSALTLYGVNVSPLEMDTEMVYYLGRLEYLEDTSRLSGPASKRHLVIIGELIQDNLVYAQVTALILVPDSQHEFDLFKLLSVDLAEKVVEAKNVAASEEAIKENVQKSEQACCRGANDNLIEDWISLMIENKKTKKKTGKVAVQNVEKTEMAVQNVEKTAPEVESMGKIKSSVDKYVQVDEFGLSCHDNQQIKSSVDKAPKPCNAGIEKIVDHKILNNIAGPTWPVALGFPLPQLECADRGPH